MYIAYVNRKGYGAERPRGKYAAHGVVWSELRRHMVSDETVTARCEMIQYTEVLLRPG